MESNQSDDLRETGVVFLRDEKSNQTGRSLQSNQHLSIVEYHPMVGQLLLGIVRYRMRCICGMLRQGAT